MVSDNLLLIFTRNPELGKVKSRLAKGVGEENALEIYKKLVSHTKEVVAQVDCTKRIGYSIKVRPNDLWDKGHFEKFVQEGEDLGSRMFHAFEQGFKDGYKNIIIIGSDLFDLKPEHITSAFHYLQSHEVVIGPAEDGGYYLLGLKQLIKEVFFNKFWGGATVYEQTMEDLTLKEVYTLETLNDIDYAEDLIPYPEFRKYIRN